MHRIVIPGKPVPAQAMRVSKMGGVYHPQSAVIRSRRAFIQDIWDKQPIQGPIAVLISYEFAPPRSTSKKKQAMMLLGQIAYCKKPDLDNLEKRLLDDMKGIVFRDDAQIYRKTSVKSYSDIEQTVILIDEDSNYTRGICSPLFERPVSSSS